MSSGIGMLVAEHAQQVVADMEARTAAALAERQERIAAAIGVGVGELAAAELAQLSGGQVQITAAMAEAPVSHAG
jgi:ABC-type Mn2+/Zn2+ transport system ATPase subunit